MPANNGYECLPCAGWLCKAANEKIRKGDVTGVSADGTHITVKSGMEWFYLTWDSEKGHFAERNSREHLVFIPNHPEQNF